ncbi:hypothetical protein POTOM_010417 [Populus tomentosa]|uniref:Subtilase family protein n=1 Tax=Populus tomentosa TaxID=118781 RepID=A0A8X8DAX2_POPTO|nr:hypothetical protein POTOM_010417 [Populus tomentosa]
MSRKKLIIPSILLSNVLIFILLGFSAATEDEPKEFFIVYLGDQPVINNVSAVQTHIDVLLSIKRSDLEAQESIIYSYTKIFNAFAAKLSKAEARKLSLLDEVLSVFPNRYHKLHTTKSWDFIGLPSTAKRNLKMERNIVVGLLDTGITPQSESFKDDGFGPPPRKWRGTCGHYANFSGCNKEFRSKVELGNGKIVSGIGVNTFEPKQKLYPIVSAADAGYSGSDEGARFCADDSLNPNKVKGKLVLCELGVWGADSVVKGIGGKGTILERIHRTQEVKVPAPFIASFSSRGPNPGSERILKPDVAAPGIDILASYTPLRSLTGLKAKPMSSRVNNDAEFAYGAGQVNPDKARNPGLVYDMDEMSYIQFLCHEGYNRSSLAVLVGSKSVNCSSLLPGIGYDALNYPTMQLSVKNKQEPTVGVFIRTVTNVGPSPSIYNATIQAPKGVDIVVKPMSLSFSRSSQKRSFKVVVKAKPMPSSQMLSDLVIFDMLSITCGSPHREEKSVVQTIIKNLAINCGFMMGALLMFFGIMDYKKILEQAKSPQRHASATFFLIIGERPYPKGYEDIVGRIDETIDHRSPRDTQGHGTHTAATAAGNLVDEASFCGLANGSAAGMKSLFGAIQKGFFVSCSAGNSGPSISSVANNAPWIMTVAACYTDGRFPATVKLGNGQTFEGSSLYSGKSTAQLPLEYGGTAGGEGAKYCISRSLEKHLVKGKIVVCETGVNVRAQKGEQVKLAGAGLLLINPETGGEELLTETHILPASSLGASAGMAVKKYVNSAKRETASIAFKGTIYGDPAPMAAAFSSRGPSSTTENLQLRMLDPVTLHHLPLFAFGSGHVDPESASDPGSAVTCPDDKVLRTGDLNYPSFAVNFEGNTQNNRVTFKRTLTNVGFPLSTYTVKVKEPNGVSVILEPQSLSFVKLGPKLSYNVTFVE